MKIVRGFPPNFNAIARVFPQAVSTTTLFAYGDTIYTRMPGPIDPALLRHEATHGARQGADPAAWWDRYLRDDLFRFEEELAAHVQEYLYIRDAGYGRSFRRHSLRLIANRLAGPLYGRMVTKARAKELIEEFSDRLARLPLVGVA